MNMTFAIAGGMALLLIVAVLLGPVLGIHEQLFTLFSESLVGTLLATAEEMLYGAFVVILLLGLLILCVPNFRS